jgi:hypothetical protein
VTWRVASPCTAGLAWWWVSISFRSAYAMFQKNTDGAVKALFRP